MSREKFDPTSLREQFPALQRNVNGRPAVYLDGPGGTQAPQAVIDAMSEVMRVGYSNLGGAFASSGQSEAVELAARQAMKDFYNARRVEEIVVGQNMTSLTFAFSRALARTWQAGDEIIVTRLDHDGNISPWLLASKDRGVTVRWLDFRPEDCTLHLEQLPDLLNKRTRLLAITHASNAVGTIPDVQRAVRLAHEAGALVYVDAVHFAPHNMIDVQALDCDFLVSSSYKYFGPHTGILYGMYEHLQRLDAYKVRPAPDDPPGKWETGTQSFESLAGVRAAVDYLAAIGAKTTEAVTTNTSEGAKRRVRLETAFARIKSYEMGLSHRFLEGATTIRGLRVYGITALDCLHQRAPTFALSLEGYSPLEVAQRLGEQGIFVWDGHYYALAVIERLGLLEKGGLVRIGFVHYNTEEEVDGVVEALRELAS